MKVYDINGREVKVGQKVVDLGVAEINPPKTQVVDIRNSANGEVARVLLANGHTYDYSPGFNLPVDTRG